MRLFLLPVVLVVSLASFALSAGPDAQNAASHLERAAIWYLKGEYDKSIAECDEVIKLDPKDANAYDERGSAWKAKGNYGKALADYDRSIKIDQNYPAYVNRGNAWNAKGNYEKALADYEHAVKLVPTSAPAYGVLARFQATCPDAKYRDGRQAFLNARTAFDFTRGMDCSIVDTLAAACAECGDFKKAVEYQTKAIEMTSSEKNKEIFRSRLELYNTGKPYREELKTR